MHITLSPSHYIYANNVVCLAANIKEHDTVCTINNDHDAIVEKKYVTELGLYNPHTLEGTIMVNGVFVSSYTSAIYPFLAHILLIPVRMLYRFCRLFW